MHWVEHFGHIVWCWGNASHSGHFVGLVADNIASLRVVWLQGTSCFVGWTVGIDVG